MPWTESGLYVATLIQALTNATALDYHLNTSKFYMTNNSDTPDYTQVAASAIYSVTNEVSGTGWAAGGILASALGAGATDITMTMTGTGTKIVTWGAQNISVATTTLTNAFGGFFYADYLSPKAKYIGIWFGGSAYSTVAGTFAVTWASNVIATVTCAV